MQRKIAVVILVSLIACVSLYLTFLLPGAYAATIPLTTSAPPLTPTAPSVGNTPSMNGLDPAIIAAIIGLAGVIVGALIAGTFALFQMRRTHQVEEKRQTEQFQHEEEMARVQKELERQYKIKEQEEQGKAVSAETLRLKMLLAPNSERLETYKKSLHADPRISQIQILNMSRPLEVNNIYIQVRVHQDTRSEYELDRKMLAAEAQRDPNALLQAGFKHLESRVSSAVNPDEAIRTYKRCVFVGDPGAGKTTLLKYLTLRSADGTLDKLPDLPIRIELNAFVASGYHDLFDFAAHHWDEQYGFPMRDARAAMEERLKEGSALLLLDALDETVVGDTAEAAEASYQQITDIIIQAATRYPLLPIAVTARKAGYHQRSPLVGFTELEVLDFRLEDMRAFVEKWFDYYTDPQKRANGADLKNKLESNPRIQALAANPLLLSLIVLVYEDQLDLPDRRAELYKECVDTLLTKWDAKRNIRRRREFKPEQKRQLLTEIAWHFHRQGRRYFPENELLEVIAHFLPTVRLLPEQNGQILDEIANEQGLLKEQARGWQGFLHLTLQEYFVAQYITHHHQQETLLIHCSDPWWEEVVLLYAGYTSDVSPFLQALLEPTDRSLPPDDIFHTNLLTAGRCLTTRPTLSQISLWDSVIERLSELLLSTPYNLTKVSTAEVLATIGNSQINSLLVQLLSNEQIDADVRRAIATALGQLGERSVAPQLVQLLSNEQIDAHVRGDIANAAGSLINNAAEISSFATLLLTRSEIADAIYSALSIASQRTGVRVFIIDHGGNREVRIVRLSTWTANAQQ